MPACKINSVDLLSFITLQMNATVSVSSSLTTPPVVLNALIANNSLKSQISKRLAERLGLLAPAKHPRKRNKKKDSARIVYVTESLQMMRGEPWLGKWKISVQPVIVTVTGVAPMLLYPLINCNERDAFWEMIIGTDCADFLKLMQISCESPRERNATPGPSFASNTHFLGHNVKIRNVGDFDEGAAPDDFFEFLCFDSEAIRRVAVNRARRQVAVVYHDSINVYMYHSVPWPLLAAIGAGESMGRAVAAIRDNCDVTTMDAFPHAALTNV